MASASKRGSSDVHSSGLPLWARITLLMSVALAIVMAVAGFLLSQSVAKIVGEAQQRSLVDTARLTAEAHRLESSTAVLRGERDGLRRASALAGQDPDAPQELVELRLELDQLASAKQEEISKARHGLTWEQSSRQATEFDDVTRVPILISEGDAKKPGFLYRKTIADGVNFDLVSPQNVERAEKGVLGLIIGITVLVILVSAGVSVMVGNQVAQPIEAIVHDVRTIAKGNLNHKTRARGGGRELGLLAKAIDRMTGDLAEARENEVELSIREREVEVASEVREALLPKSTPEVTGYSIGAEHLSSSELGGDFYDFVVQEDGRVGLLVCDVSGTGLPGALVGASARAMLHAHLRRSTDLAATLCEVNRELAANVKRGMFVSALYVLLDPAANAAQVACAGHKVPLIRWSAEDGKIRVVQPEGIAIGFDKGPIFERTLELVEVPFEPGDRVVLFNTSAVGVTNEDGEELGEKTFYQHMLRHARRDSQDFVERVRTVLEAYAGEDGVDRDVAIVTVGRDG